jgi:hypothetical protein
MQLAAGYAERHMVEFLLQVDADVEDMPAQLGDIREPGPFTACRDYTAPPGTRCEGGYTLWVACRVEGDATASSKTTGQQPN